MSDKKPLQISHPLGILHEIRWTEICPWLILVKSLRVSLMFRVLFLAYLGMQISELGWTVANQVFTDPDPQLLMPSDSLPAIERIRTFEDSWYSDHPLKQGWGLLSMPFASLLNTEGLQKNTFALISYGLWTILAWAFFGSMIARITALKLTREQSLGITDALKFARQNYLSVSGAPVITLLGILAVCIPLVIAGLLMRLDFFALLTGLCWFLVLVWGFLVACMLIGFWFGWPLMWSAVAVERSDAFDAISRSFAYVYQRPLHLAFYILLAGGLGLLGEAVVYFFVEATLYLTEMATTWGSGNQRMAEILLTASGSDSPPLNGLAGNGALAMGFWKETLRSIIPAYSMAYLWTTAVAIYLLLRRNVDSTEMDEVSIEESNEGLPPLKQNEEGLPEVDKQAN